MVCPFRVLFCSGGAMVRRWGSFLVGAESPNAVSSASAAGTAALFAPPGSLSAAARTRRKKPAGARAGMRARSLQVRMTCQRTSVASSRSRLGKDAQSTAAARVCSLWLLSLAQARESDSLAGMRGKPHRDVSRVSRSAQKVKRKSRWIPASAGMTK